MMLTTRVDVEVDYSVWYLEGIDEIEAVYRNIINTYEYRKLDCIVVTWNVVDNKLSNSFIIGEEFTGSAEIRKQFTTTATNSCSGTDKNSGPYSLKRLFCRPYFQKILWLDKIGPEFTGNVILTRKGTKKLRGMLKS